MLYITLHWRLFASCYTKRCMQNSILCNPKLTCISLSCSHSHNILVFAHACSAHFNIVLCCVVLRSVALRWYCLFGPPLLYLQDLSSPPPLSILNILSVFVVSFPLSSVFCLQMLGCLHTLFFLLRLLMF